MPSSQDPSDYGFRFNRGIPARALRLGLDQSGGDRLRKQVRLILACGDIPAGLLRALRKRGAEIQCVVNADEALKACLKTTFDVVIFDPSAPGFGAYVRLIKNPEALSSLSPSPDTRAALAAKPQDERAVQVPVMPYFDRAVLAHQEMLISAWLAEFGVEAAAGLRRRFEFVPVFVIKPSSPDEYAVLIRPPTAAYVEETSKLSIEMAILRLDARAMFVAMEPLA